MTACSAMFRKLDKVLNEKKSLDIIGQELCDTVDDPHGKAIRLIKHHKGNAYLLENAEWLCYDTSKIMNPKGRKKRLKFFNQEEQRKYFKKELINIMNEAFLALPDEVDAIFDEARKEYRNQLRF